MATTKPSLDTLPEELILTILSYISHPSTLANLSRTNTLLHRLTLPALYDTFPGRNSELFLRTISHHPHLARHTKTGIWQQDRRSITRLDMLEKQHIVNMLHTLCVPHGSDLASQFAKFGQNDDYWFFEVLLLFLPRVQRLDVRASWLWDDHHYWFKSLSPFFNPLCASALQRATIEGPMRIENVVPLLSIPSLQALHLTQVTVMRREGYRVFQWSVWPAARVLAAQRSKLKTLVLRESYIDLSLLAPLLSDVDALQHFEYEHVPNDLADSALSIPRPECESLSLGLGLHAASLQRLRIRDGESMSWTSVVDFLGGSPAGNPDTLGAEDFSALRVVDMGPIGHSGDAATISSARVRSVVDRLPVSLETVRWRIDGESSGIEDLLLAFAYALADARRAVTVQVVEWDPTLGWLPENLPALQRIYIDLGLRLMSCPGLVDDIYGAEPLFTDDQSEEGWVVVTDLRLNTKL